MFNLEEESGSTRLRHPFHASFIVAVNKTRSDEKARQIILFLGAASLVMGVAKLFGEKDNKGDKNQ